MKIYRISTKKYIYDLSGIGAELYGGRWNLPGTAMVYASESRALASMEYLVHGLIPPYNTMIAVLEIPENILFKEIYIADLPDNWYKYPAPHELAMIGTNWAKSKTSLLLRVPSAIVLQEYNILINPAHPNMKKVAIISIESFAYDKRFISHKSPARRK